MAQGMTLLFFRFCSFFFSISGMNGFSEETEDSVCTQYSSRNCDRFQLRRPRITFTKVNLRFLKNLHCQFFYLVFMGNRNELLYLLMDKSMPLHSFSRIFNEVRMRWTCYILIRKAFKTIFGKMSKWREGRREGQGKI